MFVEHRLKIPQVSESAYIAPTAVLAGDVTVGPHSRVLFGAVITAEGGPVEIGRNCVVMENAVIRGVPSHVTRIGDDVLVGPHAHLTGCVIEGGSRIATGAMVFNGARIEMGAEVEFNAVVYVNTVVPAGAPDGWFAGWTACRTRGTGRPGPHPRHHAGTIRTVFGVVPVTPIPCRRARARGLALHHKDHTSWTSATGLPRGPGLADRHEPTCSATGLANRPPGLSSQRPVLTSDERRTRDGAC
jgi:carbonic anhydrase/acetyltransferase-like protein (isoleucine patch superfamily)